MAKRKSSTGTAWKKASAAASRWTSASCAAKNAKNQINTSSTQRNRVSREKYHPHLSLDPLLPSASSVLQSLKFFAACDDLVSLHLQIFSLCPLWSAFDVFRN